MKKEDKLPQTRLEKLNKIICWSMFFFILVFGSMYSNWVYFLDNYFIISRDYWMIIISVILGLICGWAYSERKTKLI